MTEMWDLFDRDRNLLHKKQQRGKVIEKGCYHQVVSIWIRNDTGQYLISKRHPKKTYAGLWECTGGCVVSGESSIEAAVREVKEELGIDLNPQDGRLIYSKIRDELQDFYDVWLFSCNVDIESLSLQETEVVAAKWVMPYELDDMWNKGELHPLLEHYKIWEFYALLTEKINL